MTLLAFHVCYTCACMVVVDKEFTDQATHQAGLVVEGASHGTQREAAPPKRKCIRQDLWLPSQGLCVCVCAYLRNIIICIINTLHLLIINIL